MELYRVTGKSAYLNLAKYFVDQRGKGVMRGLGWLGAEYHQDRVSVREASEVEGHAVRAMYLNAGIAELYLETNETTLRAALERQRHVMRGNPSARRTNCHLTNATAKPARQLAV